MLNRLMFCYFIQKRGYLDNNIHYLQNKLKEVKSKAGRKISFTAFTGISYLSCFIRVLGSRRRKEICLLIWAIFPIWTAGSLMFMSWKDSLIKSG